MFYWNYQGFTEENGKQLDKFQERGGGLVYLHYAVDATANPQALANRIGLAWKGGERRIPVMAGWSWTSAGSNIPSLRDLAPLCLKMKVIGNW